MKKTILAAALVAASFGATASEEDVLKIGKVCPECVAAVAETVSAVKQECGVTLSAKEALVEPGTLLQLMKGKPASDYADAHDAVFGHDARVACSKYRF